MDDTPQHIKDKQLEIWLAKPPMERLKRTLQDNDDLHKLWDALRKSYNEKKRKQVSNVPVNFLMLKNN